MWCLWCKATHALQKRCIKIPAKTAATHLFTVETRESSLRQRKRGDCVGPHRPVSCPPPAVTDLNLLRCPSNEPLSGNSPYRSICLPFFSVLSPGDSVHKNVFARCSIQYVETASAEAKYIYRSLFKFCMMWYNCIFLFCSSSELENLQCFLTCQDGFVVLLMIKKTF